MIRSLFRRRRNDLPSIPAQRRVYAIGDVHGRLDLLDRLLDQIRDDQIGRSDLHPEIIMLGDLIDRGSDSAGVIDRLMSPPSWASFTILMGNHEATMLDATLGDRKMMRSWLAFGGREALISWGISPLSLSSCSIEEITDLAYKAIPQETRAWIARLRHSVTIGDYHFVHAGIRPGVPIDQQSTTDMLWIREEFLESKRDHGAIIVHGHSIATDIEDMPNRIGLDTGAYVSERLTALGLESTERWFLQTS
jgi:serine/threonine protein phosphatase 1